MCRNSSSCHRNYPQERITCDVMSNQSPVKCQQFDLYYGDLGTYNLTICIGLLGCVPGKMGMNMMAVSTLPSFMATRKISSKISLKAGIYLSLKSLKRKNLKEII